MSHIWRVRLSPIVGASSYQTKSTFSYGTHHTWLDKNVGDAATEVDPDVAWEKNLKVQNWVSYNSMTSAPYTVTLSGRLANGCPSMDVNPHTRVKF